ncbi:unnamed protein product [Rhizoctonia solani]|uniref:Uncharacterized protein n=1 Tax=Rhizoctonia solani TaxID=456999 RepID=A0A8H3ACX8_9AGAM|nr:unnamed protein product [Rhizoctonia solani]
MGKAKKTRKFATVKRMLNPNDIRLKENQTKQKQKEEKAKEEAVRRLLQNKLELVQGMMDCLYAKYCVIAELEKLGPKYRIALRVARDPRFERLPCSHEGTYADDCLVQRVTASKCYIVATCDRELRRRLGRTTTDPGSAREVNRTRAVVQSDGRHEHDTLCLAHGAAMQRGRICAVALSTISPTFAVIASVVHGRVFAVEYPQAATTESARDWLGHVPPEPECASLSACEQLVWAGRCAAENAVQVGGETEYADTAIQLQFQFRVVERQSRTRHAPRSMLSPHHAPRQDPPSPHTQQWHPSKHFKLPRLLSIQSELSNPADIELKSEASFQRLLASNADLPGAFHPHPRPRRRDRGRFPEAYLDDDDVVDSDDDDEVMLPKEFPMDDVLDSPARMDVDMGSYGSPPVLNSLFSMKSWRQTPPPTVAPSRIAKRKLDDRYEPYPQKRRALSPPPSTSTSSSSASNSNAQFNLSLPPSTTPRSPITTAAPSPRPIPTSISSSNLASTSSLAPSAPISIPARTPSKVSYTYSPAGGGLFGSPIISSPVLRPVRFGLSTRGEKEVDGAGNGVRSLDLGG